MLLVTLAYLGESCDGLPFLGDMNSLAWTGIGFKYLKLVLCPDWLGR